MKKPILVTGGTGFTGGHLCKRLIEDGYPVRALVRDETHCAHLRQLGAETIPGDLRDRPMVERAIEGTDTVYHIAALFRKENVTRKEMWETNVEGTRNMLDASIKAGVQRFIHCSTVGVHGDIKNPPANEETAYSPEDHYQESKAEGERVALQYTAMGLLPVVIFRPAGIYGPGDLRFLKLFKAISNKTFVMLGSGEIFYQMIYIGDLIDGIVLCGTKKEAIGNLYILTGEAPVTLNNLVQLVAQILGTRHTRLRFPVGPVYLAAFLCELLFKPLGINPPLYRRRVDFFRKNRSFDITKAKRELGFEPKTQLKTGLKLTAEWYRSEGLL